VSLRPCGAALLAGLLLTAAPARADLGDDAERLVRAWAERDARVERLSPVFLEHGRARWIALAPPREGEPPCLTVAVVGVRTTDFFLQRGDRAADAPARDEPNSAGLRSAGGAVTVSACGADRARLDRIRLELSAPRATLEVVTVRSATPPRPLAEVLPERVAGPLAPRGDPGGPLTPRPLAERLARAEARARGDGAAAVDRVTGRAGTAGLGRFEVELVPGCHRLEIMADAAEPPGTRAAPSAGAPRAPAPPPRPTDIDAEVRDAGGRLLARDRSDLPDARLDLCVGELTPVTAVFVGAAGAVPVILTHSRWAMPARIPARWGPRARAAFAATLLRRHAPDPAEAPVREVLGIQGITSIPLEVEPGRCYLAALALVRGDAHALRLTGILGDRALRDDAVDHAESASVTFCAEHETVARLDADVRATSAFWALAVWPMGAAAP
jgi:hypothetical protein